MDDLMPLDYQVNDPYVEAEVKHDPTVPPPKENPDLSNRLLEQTNVDDARSQGRYRKGYPVAYAPKILGEGKTKFQIWQEEQSLQGESEWAPFQNKNEWDLAQWLFKNVGQKSMDEFLKLPIASTSTHVQN